MAFNGSGVFNRIYNWVNDKNANIKIDSTRMDTETDGIATGLSNCVTKDGQTTITANLPMNSKKFTGLASGSARTDSLNVGDIQDNTFLYAGTASGTNTITANLSPAITAYVAGQVYSFLMGASPNSGATTINFNAVGAKALTQNGATAMIGGELPADTLGVVQYDGTQFQLVSRINPAAPGPIGATTAAAATFTTIDGILGSVTSAAITGTVVKADTSLELATGATVTGILDEDAMGTDSATQLATQQSIKAYADSLATQVKLGTFTRLTSAVDGVVAYTGIGFTPKAIIFLAGETNVATASIGISSGTTSATNVSMFNNHLFSAEAWNIQDDNCIFIREAIGSTSAGKITTIGTDGFSVTWAKLGTPTATATIHYLAFF